MKTFFEFGEIIKDTTEFVIFGIPWDSLTTKAGIDSHSAPKKIRDISYDLALTTETGHDIPNLKVCDMGDIALDSEDVSTNIHTIEKFVKELYKNKSDIIPIMIGGDHFSTYPTLKGIGKSINTDNVGIIVFDAHLDFYNTWKDNIYSHATITHRVFDLNWVNQYNILVVGTRDIDIPEKELAEKYNLHYFNAYELNNNTEEYIQRIINFFHSNNIEKLYLSIDIDVLDPSAAPGTGYAIPGGFSYRELWTILRKLTTFFSIIGFDMVEVAPNLDLPNDVTCTIAAKIIIELISFIQNI